MPSCLENHTATISLTSNMASSKHHSGTAFSLKLEPSSIYRCCSWLLIFAAIIGFVIIPPVYGQAPVAAPAATAAADPNSSSKPLEVRLVDGPNNQSGRVEVRRNSDDEWGTVCDDEFGHQDAQVVCRMLGSTGGRAVRQAKVFGRGTGPIRLDNLNCRGDETSLADCPNRGWNTHDCSHNEDAGVVCGAMSEIEIRLVGGFAPNQGRIEMRTKPPAGSQNSSLWGTVCNDGLNKATGDVICRMLNFTGGAMRADERLGFGPGTGPVLVDRVVCTGNETDISDCNLLTDHRRWCSNADDAGVICRIDLAAPPLQLRMVQGQTANEGRVEIARSGIDPSVMSWGTVCDQGWDSDAARVVCRSLGSEGPATAVGPGYFNAAGANSVQGPLQGMLYTGASSTVVRRVACTGKERHLSECEILGMDESTMTRCRGNDAGVICLASSDMQDFELRLVNNNGQINNTEGRVEVRRRNRGFWGTVCDDQWGVTESELVCRLLGRPGIAVTRKSAFYGPGNGSITLDDVKCQGNETNLGQCAFRGVGFHDCQHSEDVGVLCIGERISDYKMRLTGGLQSSEGRLEVRRHELEPWGTVCDDGWNMLNAKVVCRKMGYGGNVSYTGSGTRLTLQAGQVSSSSGSGSGSSSVGFAHHIAIASLSNDRLMSPSSLTSLGSGSSGGVVGLGIGGSLVHFDTSSLDMPIHLAWVNCTGNETDLIQCGNAYNYTWGKHACSHSEDVYVSCQTNHAPSLEVRLEGGLWPWEGTVRLRNSDNGEWGTICDDDWDAKDAGVICRMLGYNGTARPYTASHFGRGTGPIYLDNVNCEGTEANIYFCNLKVWGQHDCTHAEDAGVACNPAGGSDNASRDGVNPFMDAMRRPIMDAINMTKGYFDEMFDKHMSKFTEMFRSLNRTVMATISTRISKIETDALPGVAERLRSVEGSSKSIDDKLVDIQSTLRNSSSSAALAMAQANVHSSFLLYFFVILAILAILLLVMTCLCRRRLEDAYDYVQFRVGKRSNGSAGRGGSGYGGSASASSSSGGGNSHHHQQHDRQPIVFQDSIDLERQELDELSQNHVYQSLSGVNTANNTLASPRSNNNNNQPSTAGATSGVSATGFNKPTTPNHHGFKQQNLFDD